MVQHFTLPGLRRLLLILAGCSIRRDIRIKHIAALVFVYLIALSLLVACGDQSLSATGQHITKLQTGTGFDQRNHTVQGERSSFELGETIHVIFTVNTSDKNGLVVLRILHGGLVEDTSLPLTIQQGSHIYEKSIDTHATGKYTVKIGYNGANEAEVDFSVN